jgi:hypothetical protein
MIATHTEMPTRVRASAANILSIRQVTPIAVSPSRMYGNELDAAYGQIAKSWEVS